MSFGEAFGKLIKRLRGIEGMTQQGLAEIAFGDGSLKARISDLENGKIANPQAKTIDALVVALNISTETMAGLLKQSPDNKVLDNIMDFFEIDERGVLNFEVAVNDSGKAVFFHDLALNTELKRVEFFVEERMVVLLSKSGIVRRSSTLPVGKDVTLFIQRCNEVLFVRLNPKTNEAISGASYPLKIIH